VDSALIVLALCGVGLFGWLIYTVRQANVTARSALKGIEDLADAFRRAHPYPAATAEVLPSPAPAPVVQGG
jgi:hypothetical protein